MQFHPDKNPGTKKPKKNSRKPLEPTEVLSDPQKRAQYDRFGHEAFTGRGGGGAGFQDVEDIFSHFGDIFGDFFGGGMGQQQRQRRGRNEPRRGSDLRYVTEVTLKEVISGVEKEIEFDTDKNCDDCKGTGAEKGSASFHVHNVGGSGQVVRSQGFLRDGISMSNMSRPRHCN